MSPRLDRIRTIELAEKHIKAGRLREAAAEYEKLVESDPQDIGTVNILGDLYVRLGQGDKAVRSFALVAEEYEKRGLYSQSLAIVKKIIKISPDNADFTVKLADLFAVQGFASDAKREYLRIAEVLLAERRTMEAVRVFEKLVRLDKDDPGPRRRLVDLYKAQGALQDAVRQLNEIAEGALAVQDVDAAEKALAEARELDPSDRRAVLNLVQILKTRGDRAGAVALLESAAQAESADPRILSTLGSFYFEDGDYAKAESIFADLIESNPANVAARVKLGRMFILKDRLDQAFELFDPLVNSLLKKRKEDKAIGLLGLLLAGRKTYPPALERLAGIYRTGKEARKLEVVDRVLLEELRGAEPRERILPVLTELVQLRPDDGDLAAELRRVRQALGLPEIEEQAARPAAAVTGEDREAIRATLAQAELYMQQGLARNAKRILDNLRLRFPDEPEVEQKAAMLEKIRTRLDEEDLRRRVEKASALDTRTDGGADKPRRAAFPRDAVDEDKLSTVDIFAETDIIPFVTVDTGEIRFYELREAIETEMRMMQSILTQQSRGGTTQFEKELSNIVADFKNGLQERFQPEDHEIHYQLGLAFLEQGLYAEAIEELSLASRDRLRALECYSIISDCHRRKRNYAEAEKWLRKALLLAKQGTDGFFSLEYELAALFEENRDRENALSLYKEVLNWNPAYRAVSEKVNRLEKAPANVL